MAILTPIANSISAFDAKNIVTFSYVISGGNQIVKNKLVITNVSTNQIVYSNIESTYINNQTLPANTLTNGIQYSYYFTVFDSDGNESNQSNVVKFYCYTTPILEFSNIVSDSIINSSSYNFQIKYEQNEDELIKSLILKLYDSNNNLVSTSSTLTSSSPPPLYLNYTFSNFLNDVKYKVVANLYTEENTFVTTEVSFYVNYYASNIYSILSLTDNCDDGYVELNNNMIIIDGKSNPNPPTYINNNTEVNLSSNGSYVLWDNGYIIDGNITICAKFTLSNVGDIIYLWDSDLTYDYNKIVISILKEIPYGESMEKYYAKLTVCNGDTICYSIYSNYIDSYENLFLWVRRINNIYEIKIESEAIV